METNRYWQLWYKLPDGSFDLICPGEYFETLEAANKAKSDLEAKGESNIEVKELSKGEAAQVDKDRAQLG